MKNIKVIPFLVLLTTSSVAVASGMHSGGHGHSMKDSQGQHWMAPAEEAARHNPVMASADSINKGAKLFQQNCAACHGAKADGNGMAGMMLKPRPANLRAMSGTHPDGDFAYKIRVGRGAMPSWQSALNEEQVWHLVNYIQALNKNPVATQQEETGHHHAAEHGHDS